MSRVKAAGRRAEVAKARSLGDDHQSDSSLLFADESTSRLRLAARSISRKVVSGGRAYYIGFA